MVIHGDLFVTSENPGANRNAQRRPPSESCHRNAASLRGRIGKLRLRRHVFRGGWRIEKFPYPQGTGGGDRHKACFLCACREFTPTGLLDSPCAELGYGEKRRWGGHDITFLGWTEGECRSSHAPPQGQGINVREGGKESVPIVIEI